MTNKQPEALIFANDRPSEIGDDLYQWASDAEDMIRRLDARIVELEAQLAAAQPAAQGMEQEMHLGGVGTCAKENDLALSPSGWLPKNIEDASAIRTSDGALMKVQSVEIIRVVCASGSAVAIKEDCSLFVEDGADLQEAAESIVTATFQVINANSFRPHNLTSFIQLRNSRGAVLAVNIDGDVQASPEWPQDTIDFAKMIGKAMLNRFRNLPEKQAIEAMELALSSHGIQLLSSPPQDAWIARGVSEKLRAAIAALTAQAGKKGVRDGNR